jgi:hypothetical protein
MQNVGGITNNMTFTNTYLLDDLIQGEGKGLITTSFPDEYIHSNNLARIVSFINWFCY